MTTKDEIDLAHARGIIADCCHHSDTAIIAACDTILMLDGSGEDAERARELRATVQSSAGEIVTEQALASFIVRLGIGPIVHRRLICINDCHIRSYRSRVIYGLNFGQQTVKPFTKFGVVSGSASKVENQLNGSNGCHAEPRRLPYERKLRTKSCNCPRAEENTGKRKRFMQSRKRGFPHVMVKGRAQQLELKSLYGRGGLTPGGKPLGSGRGGSFVSHVLFSPISDMSPLNSHFIGGVAGRASNRGLHQNTYATAFAQDIARIPVEPLDHGGSSSSPSAQPMDRTEEGLF